MMKISLKVVSAIFNIDCTEAEVNGNTIYWYTRDGGIARGNMNAYEFMHRCKEWAISEGYFLETRYIADYDKYRCLIHYDENDQEHTEPCFIPLEESEFNAVVEAVEWIKKKEKK